jgi:hypothetical protein
VAATPFGLQTALAPGQTVRGPEIGHARVPQSAVEKEKSKMFVVVINERSDNVRGGFDSREEAERWAREHCIGWCWRVVKLTK